MINCPYCGKLTDPQLDSCVHCGGFLKKQSPRAQRKSATPSQTCPSCGALVRDGDIICVACGTNLLTGQKIAEERKQVREPRNPVSIIIAVAAAVAIILIGILVIIYLTRDPVVRAQKLSAANRTTEAIDLLDNHVTKHPRDARAQFQLGKLYWTIGDFEPAAKAFEEALTFDSDNRQAGINAVLSYAERGADATRQAQIAVLSKMVSSDPDDTEALYLLGLAQGAQGDYFDQVGTLEKAAGQGDSDVNVGESLGVALALDKQYPAAEQELRAALERSPGDGDILAALGHLASLQGKPEEAEGHLRAAVNAGTEVEHEALTRLGLSALQAGKVLEARVFLGQALEAGSDDPAAIYFHAVCLSQQRSVNEAEDAFEELSNRPGPFSAPASMQLARLSLDQKNPERALEALNRITVTPSGTECAALETLRGRVYAALGETDTALDAFRRAGQCDPTYPPVHLENGLVQVQRGNVPEGVRELERYLNLVDASDPGSGAKAVQGLINQLKGSAEAGTPATAMQGITEGGLS